jgi:hypothetical protein
MLNFLAFQNFDHFTTLAVSITVIGITFSLINNLRQFNNVILERQIDTARVHEGLPTDMTLTPEDFTNHPELAEIFGVTDTNSNLNLILESNEHFEQVENQLAAIDYNNLITLYEVVEAFITSFF